MSNWHTEETKELFEALLTLSSVEECAAFLEDVCTIKEVQDIAQRLKVARLLHAGCSYHTISEQTGASTATISRVSRCLEYGSGGYRTVIARLEEQEGERRQES